MDYLSKQITVASILILSSATFSNSASASFTNNDAQNLTECRRLLNAEIGDVERTKVANIKSKARSFTVKYKVVDGGERSVVQCTLARNKEASVSCLEGNACNVETVASQKQ